MKKAFKRAGWMVVTLPLVTGTAVFAQGTMEKQPLPKTQPMPDAAAQQPDASMQKVLDAHKTLKPKPFHTLTPAEARKGPTAKDAVMKVLKDEKKPTAPEKLGKVDDTKIPGPAGDIPVRIYTPEGKGPFPVIVYYHGGGFVVADLDVYDAGPRALAKQANAVVVSVHYRQAPEHPFPAAVDDADAAYRYVHQNAAKYNGDPKRIAVAGESAGGNLATVVAMREKDTAAAPVFQLLVYPFVSNDLKTPSHVANGQGNYFVGNQDIAWFWKNYLGDGWQTNQNPEALPLYANATQLKGLPPAFIITAGLDPLKDEGEMYGKKLEEAGVKAQVRNYDGVTHEFFGMAPVVGQAAKAQADAAAALKTAFQASPATGGNPMKMPMKDSMKK